jgi:hypothetical protein
MAMRSTSAPRRIYVRAGSFVVCYGGVYFGPKANAESAFNLDKEVRIEVLEKSGNKARIQVTQKVGKNAIVETWLEKHLTFEPRAAKSE